MATTKSTGRVVISVVVLCEEVRCGGPPSPARMVDLWTLTILVKSNASASDRASARMDGSLASDIILIRRI